MMQWQLVARLSSKARAFSWVDEAQLLARRGMTGSTGNLYVGLHEYSEMALVIHALGPGDLFVDVGANVGSYTVLASKVAGARTIAFEPVPESRNVLEANLALNDLRSVVDVRASAVGDLSGSVRFTRRLDTVNHVASTQEFIETLEVPIVRLDDSLAGLSPTMIKVDVEGFELQVLRGSSRMLADSHLLAMIVELNGSGARYGSSDEAVHNLLVSHGFFAVTYNPVARKVHLLQPHFGGNVIYVRDREEISRRVQRALARKVHPVARTI